MGSKEMALRLGPIVQRVVAESDRIVGSYLWVCRIVDLELKDLKCWMAWQNQQS